MDSVLVGGGGALQLRDELGPALARRAPSGGEIVLLVIPGSRLQALPGLRVVPVPKPRGAWAGHWWWYRRKLPSLIGELRGDAVYLLSGVVSRRVARVAAVITNFNNTCSTP